MCPLLGDGIYFSIKIVTVAILGCVVIESQLRDPSRNCISFVYLNWRSELYASFGMLSIVQPDWYGVFTTLTFGPSKPNSFGRCVMKAAWLR